MQTIKTILTEMKETVEQGKIQSPTWWVDKAISLTALWQDLKDEMTKSEMAYKSEIVTLLEEGKKKGEAEFMVEAKSKNYKMYCYIKGRDKIIDEFIKLAKKRASIENYQD